MHLLGNSGDRLLIINVNIWGQSNISEIVFILTPNMFAKYVTRRSNSDPGMVNESDHFTPYYDPVLKWLELINEQRHCYNHRGDEHAHASKTE